MKNRVLKISVIAAALLAAVTACMADSETPVPWIVCLICGIYLLVFVYANYGIAPAQPEEKYEEKPTL